MLDLQLYLFLLNGGGLFEDGKKDIKALLRIYLIQEIGNFAVECPD